MVFDDSFFQLTGDKDKSSSGSFLDWSSSDEDEEVVEQQELDSNEVKEPKPADVSADIATVVEDENTIQEEVSSDNDKTDSSVIAGSISAEDISNYSNYTGDKWSSEYGNPDYDYVIESDIVMPSIKPQRSEATTPLVLVIDDDFNTLDLMKIYFARGYEYVSFSGPREAIFFLNERIPDLIFLDCYIHTIKAARVVDIIHSYKELEDVPIIYLCEDYEYGAIYSKLPAGVKGLVKRPVSRKDIQSILDKYFK